MNKSYSALRCSTTKLKIISFAVEVIEPCTDVANEGKAETTQCIYRVSQLCQIHFVWLCLCESGDCFVFLACIHSFCCIFIYSIISQSCIWTVVIIIIISEWPQLTFANLKAIWLFRALRSPLHHKWHPPEAYAPARKRLSWWTLQSGNKSLVCLCLSVCDCVRKTGYFI